MAYRKVTLLKPDYVTAHINLASAYGFKGLPEKAISELEHALELDPDNVDAHYNLGVAYQSMAIVDKALAQYKKVLKLNPDDKEALNNLRIIKEKSLETVNRDGSAIND